MKASSFLFIAILMNFVAFSKVLLSLSLSTASLPLSHTLNISA